jgi:hypothetical protein
MPYTKSTEAMFYNKTMFDAKGWRFRPLGTRCGPSCATIKATPRSKASTRSTPFGYDSDDNLFITYDEQSGIFLIPP